MMIKGIIDGLVLDTIQSEYAEQGNNISTANMYIALRGYREYKQSLYCKSLIYMYYMICIGKDHSDVQPLLIIMYEYFYSFRSQCTNMLCSYINMFISPQ